MAKGGNKRDFGEHATKGGNKHEFGEYATKGGNKREFGEHATKSGYISVILAGNSLFSSQFPTLLPSTLHTQDISRDFGSAL